MDLSVIIVALTLVVCAAAIIVTVVYDRHLLKPRKRVNVSTVAGYGASGILHRRGRRTIVLRDVKVQVDGDGLEQRPPVPVDGELVIDRDQIVWIQVVGS